MDLKEILHRLRELATGSRGAHEGENQLLAEAIDKLPDLVETAVKDAEAPAEDPAPAAAEEPAAPEETAAEPVEAPEPEPEAAPEPVTVPDPAPEPPAPVDGDPPPAFGTESAPEASDA